MSSKSALLKFIAKPFLLTKGKKEGERKKGTKKKNGRKEKEKVGFHAHGIHSLKNRSA